MSLTVSQYSASSAQYASPCSRSKSPHAPLSKSTSTTHHPSAQRRFPPSPISIRVPPSYYSKTLSRRSTTPPRAKRAQIWPAISTKRNEIQGATPPLPSNPYSPEIALNCPSSPPALPFQPFVPPISDCSSTLPRISRRPACDPSHIPHTQAFLEPFSPVWPLTTAITTRLSTIRPRLFIANFTGTGGFWLIDASTPELRADSLTILYCGRDWNARTRVLRLSLHPPDRAHDLASSPRRQQPATVNRLRENFEHCMVNSMASVRE